MGGIDKVFAPLLGRPLLAWSIDAFNTWDAVDSIVVAVDRHRIQDGRALVRAGGWSKVTQVCRGGRRRQDSVREALWRLGPCDWVAVHDGARPCVTPGLMTAGYEAARETGAAVPGLLVVDTLKRVAETGEVLETVDRAGLHAVQTPQFFRRDLLWAAHERDTADATDDAAQVERTGGRVRLFPGDPLNIKVTVPGDLDVVAAALQRRGRAAS